MLGGGGSALVADPLVLGNLFGKQKSVVKFKSTSTIRVGSNLRI